MEECVFITIKEVQRLLGCQQYNTALRQHQAARKAFNKKSKYLTIKEYCLYLEVNYEEILDHVKKMRHTKKET